MSLLFHRFPDVERAERFVQAVWDVSRLDGQVFATFAESQAADPFPFVLDPPIVHIDRDEDPDVERCVEAAVLAFGGTFAGT